MVTSAVLLVLVVLPAALAHPSKLDSIMEQVRKIRDFRDLGEVVERERERAVITTGIIPVLQHSAEIERFLEANKEFAKEFGTFAQNAVYLAELYLGPVYSMQLYLDEGGLI